MDDKPYQLGILVGRFQVLHLGHNHMIQTALSLCNQVAVFVGSSQESGTNKNPYSYEQRERMLRTVFGNSIAVYPLPDIGVGNNSRWGDYVLENVDKHFGRRPDLLISGKEARRTDWFENAMGISELYIPKILDISASAMRQFLVEDDYAAWSKYVDPALLPLYATLRETALKSVDNLKTESM